VRTSEEEPGDADRLHRDPAGDRAHGHALLALILALGIFPRLLFGVQDAAVTNLVGFLGG